MNIERKIYVNNDLDIVVARMQAREMAKQMGFGTADQARISLAASELARILSWTTDQPSEIIVSAAAKNGHRGIKVMCLVDLDHVPSDKVNEAGESLEQKLYLANACHLVDESIVEAQDEKHTRVTLMQWLKSK